MSNEEKIENIKRTIVMLETSCKILTDEIKYGVKNNRTTYEYEIKLGAYELVIGMLKEDLGEYSY